MKRKYLLPAIIIPVSIFLDYITKIWAVNNLKGKPPITIIDGFFNFIYAENRGAAWGMFGSWSPSIRVPFFIAITVVAMGVLSFVYKKLKEEQIFLQIAFSLIAGGAIGNFIDRVFIRHVVDFIDWHIGKHHWPTFNIADVAISIGMVLILLDMFLDWKKKQKTGEN